MTVQAIAFIYVKDMEIMKQYKEKAADALARHGGKVISAGPPQEVLEAAMEVPDAMALIEFPSVEKAKAWRNDPELSHVHALRNKGGKSTILVIPG